VGLILDTSVLIAAEREAFDLEALLTAEQDGDVAIAAITASELLHGVERARDPAVRAQRQRTVEGLLDAFPALPFALPEARVHARLWAALAAKGRVIGAHDLQVAATALSAAHALATLNQRDFKRVPGLVLRPLARFTRA
jgi:tRNA(fMet)-specific endonuclease VapC